MIFTLTGNDRFDNRRKTEIPKIQDLSTFENKTHFQAMSELYNKQTGSLSPTKISTERISPFALMGRNKKPSLPTINKFNLTENFHNHNVQEKLEFLFREEDSLADGIKKISKEDPHELIKRLLLKTHKYRNKYPVVTHLLKKGAGHLVSGMGLSNEQVYDELRTTLNN